MIFIIYVKGLLDTLETEYGLNDAEIERFNASNFNKFKLVDVKFLNDQIHEFQDYIRHM